ncbi:MAG TPA: T9SS type A sorting domain-containing protein [Chitinophagales bacterium]|nr:T9SS type A sorting domain-containing protein [Chitinophagales bacterium]
MPFSEVPKGMGTSVMGFSGLMMSGIDAQGKHHLAIPYYNQVQNTYYDGPVATQYDSAYDSFYRRVFKITRQQIDQHRAEAVPVPVGAISTAVKLWPAVGNPYVTAQYGVNIHHRMAPFIDADGNGSYDPAMGDYPAFCGDQAVFFVYNDERGSHDSIAGSNNLGFEVRGMAEQFLDVGTSLTKNPVNNSVFVHYEIENLSANTYSDFYVGMNSDPDVGCYSNDAVGCDTSRNLAYAYNRTLTDNDCNGVAGYRNLSAAVGVQRLDAPLSSFSYFTNGGTFNPITDSNHYYYLRGFWGDGAPITEGANGRGGTTATKYMYPGTPTDTTAWSEVTAMTQMGDRRFLACSGPGTFAPEQIRSFDYAFFASYDSTASHLTIVDTLRRDADVIQQFYNANLVNCRNSFTTNIAERKENTLQFSVYPNPASSLLMVETSGMIDLAELKDMLGRTVLSQKAHTGKLLLDVSLLAKGVYLLKIEAAGKTAVKKIVVE